MAQVYHLSDFSPFYAKEQQFLIVPFEQLHRPSPLIWPHTHSFYEILWIRAGGTRHKIDDHELDLSSDTIYFMSPGQVHQLAQHSDVKGESIMFTEEFFITNFTNREALDKLSFLRNSYKNPHLQINQETKRALEPVLQLMYSEFARRDHSRLALSSLLFVLLNWLERVYETQKNAAPVSGQPSFLDKFSKLLERHYAEQQPLTFYASVLCITPQHLNIVMKKATGKTAGDAIRERVMLEAKRMLIHTDFPIGHISDRLGFNNSSYFSRQFKKNHHLTPERYRAEMLGRK